MLLDESLEVSAIRSQVARLLADENVPSSLTLTTSGSIATPKRVRLSARAIRASAEASAARVGRGNWFLALPAHYVAGLNVIVRAELAGGTLVTRAEAPSFADAARLLGPGGYTSLVPAQLAALRERELTDPPGAAREWAGLAQFACVLVGGQRLDAPLRTHAEQRGVRLVETYGASETCGGCVYDGIALAGVDVRFAPPRDGAGIEPAAPGAIDAHEGTTPAGELWISGPMLADGYVTATGELDPVLTEASFIWADGTRWYRTRDRARLSAAHGASSAGSASAGATLQVLGRIDRVLISGGLKLDLDEVQAALDDWLGHATAIAVDLPSARFGQSLGVWRVSRVSTAPAGEEMISDAELAARLEGRFGRVARPVIARGPARVLASGKPDYAGYRAALADGN